MTELLEQIEHTITERGLFHSDETILAAVSGGVDSVVMLDLLHRLAPRHRWRLTIAHFNHWLRGRHSDADERLVRRTAEQLKLPLIAESADVKEFARRGKVSIEMAARQLRHAFLARTARAHGRQTIALAHQADDQVELFFLRLLRGAGTEGLGGMRWISSSPADQTIRVVRPLLSCSKEALRAYAAEHRLAFREDASNASPDVLRNRIRQELLPLLRQRYQPALSKVIERVMDILRAEGEFIEVAAQQWFARKTRRIFARLPVAVQRRGLAQQLIERGRAPEFGLIERLRSQAETRVMIAPGCQVWRDAHGQVHGLNTARAEFSPEVAAVTLAPGGGQARFDGVAVKWRVLKSRGPIPARPGAGREWFDADKIGTSVVLRHWQQGDRYLPTGMSKAVKIQDLFVNRKIPRAHRHRLIVAATARGEIWWVEGLRMSERFKVSARTLRRLEWRWRRKE